ncbi:unnamed protein product, partial [Mesorhabditis spiculigera]
MGVFSRSWPELQRENHFLGFARQRTKSISSNTRRFSILYWGTFATTFLYFVSDQLGYTTEILHESYRYTYKYEPLRYIRLLVIFYNITVWNIALHTYICFSNIMYWEAKKFNKKLRVLKTTQTSHLLEKVENMIRLHTQLGRCTRELDRIFQVFAFLMVCTIIPSTLFTLALVLTRSSLFGLVLCIPSVCYCAYGYYGVTLTPATLHEELSKSKAILCMTESIWVPFESKLNRVAHTLLIHLDQADLGISLWGFALVTKPMILTTVSVMMTCLAFFLELKPKECPGFHANSTAMR